MSIVAEKLDFCDPIWLALRSQADESARAEPSLASFVHVTILKHERLEDALSYHLAKKIGGEDLSPMLAREIFDEALEAAPEIGEAVRADLSAVFERDPACHRYLDAFLFYKGFLAIQSHRIAHWLWREGRTPMALFFQSRVSEIFGVDIHPAARLGRGIMMDHATGIVIGETAVVEDDVSMLHGVNLGGTGKEKGDRHPKIRRGGRQDSGQYRSGRIFPRWGGQRRAEICAGQLHGRGRARKSHRLRRLRAAVPVDESDDRRRGDGLPDLTGRVAFAFLRRHSHSTLLVTPWRANSPVAQ
jgi:serine O-acetyltransferase